MTTLPEYVALIRSIQPDPPENTAAIPGGFYEFLQTYATLRDGAPLPEGMEQGEIGYCYQNAATLALIFDRFTYCEGLASSGTGMVYTYNDAGKLVER